MAWFKKIRKPIEGAADKSRVPEGLWVKCPPCGQIIYNKDLAASLSVCTKCGHHFRLTASERLRSLFEDSWEEHDSGLMSTDPLRFTDTKPYRERLETSMQTTGLRDAVISATGSVGRMECNVAAMEYGFVGGSMGVVEDHPRHRTLDGEAFADHHRFVLGRGTDDGGSAVADADGKNQRRARAARSCPGAVHIHSDGSHHRRRDRELCDVG